MAHTVRRKLSSSGDHSRRRDRISHLPDDLLVQILVLLPLVEAVRTCVLSHCWRHVWTRLPLLDFGDGEDATGVSSLADLVTGVILGYAPDVHMPEILISAYFKYDFAEAVRIAASAFLAAPRARYAFHLFMSQHEENEEEAVAVAVAPPLLMPCFPLVTELSLTFLGLGVELRLPYTGTFFRLTKLYIHGVRFTDDGTGISEVVSCRCPLLRDLDLLTIENLKVLIIVSESLLTLRILFVALEQLQVVATNLRNMKVIKNFVLATEPTVMLLNAPELEQFHWEDRCPNKIYPSSLPSQLSRLTVIELSLDYLAVCNGRQSQFTRILQTFERINTLSLELPIAPESAEQRYLIETADISFFRELDLTVKKNEHTFGLTVLRLLTRHKWMRKFSLKIMDDIEEDENIIPTCAPACDCRKIKNVTDKITLDYLNWVVMKNFSATEDERILLYAIVKNAKALRKVSIVFSMGVEPHDILLHTLNKLVPSGCTIECLGNI